jgi:hypothetical protein
MSSTAASYLKGTVLIALSLAIGAMGIYVAEADDAPGGAVIGLMVMICGVMLGVGVARDGLPAWVARTALAVGILMTAFLAFVTHAVVVTGPLFAQPQDVPSTIDSAPSAQHAAPVDRARALVRAAILEQNLPGVSVAVGADNTIVWAEGFGWRDVDTRTPMTPSVRFNIGTAASAISSAAVAPLGLTNTGAEPAAAWSPAHIGEPEEDFPLFTLVRDVIFRPIGMASAQPLPGDRATFYVPRSDDNPRRGRRLMHMRDLACCAGTLASYSTAPDLVRVGLASNRSVNGELAGGRVMSLITRRDGGTVIAVLSNIAHANTYGLGQTIGDAFAKHAR